MVVVAVNLFPRTGASSSVTSSSSKEGTNEILVSLLLHAAIVAICCTRGIAICEGCGCSFLCTQISKLLVLWTCSIIQTRLQVIFFFPKAVNGFKTYQS